jgi:hypothetical protein
MLIEQASDEEKLQVAKELYSKKWSISSDHFQKNGYYEWMADQLKKFEPKKIFDVGTGSGNSIINLYNAFNTDDFHILSIDENLECLQEAQSNILTNIDANPVLIPRISVEHKSIIHSYSYEQIDYSADNKIILLESDFLTEPCLDDIKRISGKFDAVTIWLLGTHDQRYACYQLGNKIKSSRDYRLMVQNKTYEFADEILKKGGVLQVVDRAELPKSSKLEKDFINSHKDQASVTDLEVEELNYIEYEEPEVGKGMEMSTGKSGRIPDEYKRGLLSIISIKKNT